MLTLRQIEVFAAVMRSGSVIGAARELRIAQPTVSRIILRIQDQLGLRLFDRVRGRLVPTPEARRFLAEIERAFAQMRIAIDRAADSSRPGRTPLRVGASPSLGRGLAPGALARLAQAFPDLALQLDVVSVAQVMPFLVEKVGDVALTLHPVIHHDVVSTRIGEAEPVLVLPRLPAFAAVTGLRDLPPDCTWLVFQAFSVHGEALAAIFEEAAIRPSRTHTVRFAESAVALAEAGLGVTVVDAFSARGAIADRVRLLPLASRTHFSVYLHRALDGGVGAVADAFEGILRDEVAALSMPPGHRLP